MPVYIIEVRKDSRLKLALPFVERTAKKILKELNLKKIGLGILLVDDKQIRILNKKYLKHDRPTDVIAFSQLEGRPIATRFPWLGDLVISLETTERQAKQYGNDFQYEFAFYLCHGILHLLGHSDKTSAKSKWMENKQVSILKKIGLEA